MNPESIRWNPVLESDRSRNPADPGIQHLKSGMLSVESRIQCHELPFYLGPEGVITRFSSVASLVSIHVY